MEVEDTEMNDSGTAAIDNQESDGDDEGEIDEDEGLAAEKMDET